MTRAVIRREEVPSGTPYREWTNITGCVLQLKLPGLSSLRLCPGGRLQIPCEDLAMVPDLEPWLEGKELRGVLRASA